MAITKVSRTLATDPIDPTKNQIVIHETAEGIIIDIVTNIGGGDPVGRIFVAENSLNGGSVWFKVEYGKIITVLTGNPGGAISGMLRENYTNWNFARFCVLQGELCYLVYTSSTHKDTAHRVYPFDGFLMQQGDAIYIEINSTGNYARLYYPLNA
ncbi:MAG: hypothetical protein SFV22_08835 [Saprospiraceae bacterium]|nr:hypothetical protein [Saprospiraceae bacterium]